MSHILLCPRKERRNVVYSGNTTRLAFLTDPSFPNTIGFFPYTFECRYIRTYICTFIEASQLKRILETE
jgi:hypothetical protein